MLAGFIYSARDGDVVDVFLVRDTLHSSATW